MSQDEEKFKLIGIGGTNGAGKDIVGEMLAKRHGWLFVSVSDILRAELKRLGQPIERKNLRLLSAQWRREQGLGILIDKALAEFKAQGGVRKFKGLAISSLRNYGEADRVHELGGRVVWVDADPKIRYQRISARVRSPEDHKTYEEFIDDEQEEMRHFKGDKATLDLAGVKARADIFLRNDGSDPAAFFAAAEKSLPLTQVNKT